MKRIANRNVISEDGNVIIEKGKEYEVEPRIAMAYMGLGEIWYPDRHTGWACNNYVSFVDLFGIYILDPKPVTTP